MLDSISDEKPVFNWWIKYIFDFLNHNIYSIHYFILNLCSSYVRVQILLLVTRSVHIKFIVFAPRKKENLVNISYNLPTSRIVFLF